MSEGQTFHVESGESPRLLSGRVTISRVPIVFSLCLGAVNLLGEHWQKPFAWEWVFLPWCAAACVVAYYNHRVDFGSTGRGGIAWALAIISAALVLMRLGDIPSIRNFGWWALLAPFWGGAVIVAMHSWTREYRTFEIAPSGRLYFSLLVLVLLKSFRVGPFADFSWVWMVVIALILWGFLSLYNVVGLGGGRYFPPAAAIFAVTIVIAAVHHAEHGAAMDLAWLLLLFPAVLYGLFCRFIALPRLRSLKKKMKKRNEYIQSRSLDKSLPAEISLTLDDDTICIPLPGANPRFRIFPAILLSAAVALLEFVVGAIGSFGIVWLSIWSAGWLWWLGPIVLLVLSVLGYWVIYLPSCFGVFSLAKRFDCGHRPTLWFAATNGTIGVLAGMRWSIIDYFLFTDPLRSGLSIGVVPFCGFIILVLFMTLAGCLGLVAMFRRSDKNAVPEVSQ